MRTFQYLADYHFLEAQAAAAPLMVTAEVVMDLTAVVAVVQPHLDLHHSRVAMGYGLMRLSNGLVPSQ
jgi:hypothetical protein